MELKKTDVGRIVHYTTKEGTAGISRPRVLAAMIVEVPEGDEPYAHLRVFARPWNHGFSVDYVLPAEDGVEAGTEAARGYWQWPKREE